MLQWKFFLETSTTLQEKSTTINHVDLVTTTRLTSSTRPSHTPFSILRIYVRDFFIGTKINLFDDFERFLSELITNHHRYEELPELDSLKLLI